jgi:hypothetical protein
VAADSSGKWREIGVIGKDVRRGSHGTVLINEGQSRLTYTKKARTRNKIDLAPSGSEVS